jgi:hypothetical protein
MTFQEALQIIEQNVSDALTLLDMGDDEIGNVIDCLEVIKETATRALHDDPMAERGKKTP